MPRNIYVNIIIPCCLSQKMASFDTGYEDERFQHPVGRGFHCCICTNVIKDPVMCSPNEHLFCRACITQHLKNSRTCPTCREPLTVETLKQASRNVTNLLYELKIRCQFFTRGCTQFVELENLESHEVDCGFAPAVCSNEGCQLEVNKQDLLHHETAVCEQRRVVCHSCNDIRREMDTVKVSLGAINEKLGKNEKNLERIERKMTESQENLKAVEKVVENVVEKVGLVQQQFNKQEESISLFEAETKKSLNEITTLLKTLIPQTASTEDGKKGIAEADEVDGEPKVIIAGGRNEKGALKSVEMFSLLTRSWTPLQPMREIRVGASSVAYNDDIIVSGGVGETSMEKLSLNVVQGGKSASWEDVPVELTVPLHGHRCVIHDGRLIVIGGYGNGRFFASITEISLVPPCTSKLLATMPDSTYLNGVAIFGDKIMIVGSVSNRGNVLEYDITKNAFRRMASLPYHVYNMAMIKWGDINFIILGGTGRKSVLSKVLVYNIKSEKSSMLPEMLNKREGCVAAVVDDTILVMGGKDEDGKYLKSAESFRFDRFTWEELPDMTEERFNATGDVLC